MGQEATTRNTVFVIPARNQRNPTGGTDRMSECIAFCDGMDGWEAILVIVILFVSNVLGIIINDYWRKSGDG